MDWYREHTQLMDTEITKEGYKTFVQKWRRNLHRLETLQSHAAILLHNTVASRRILKQLIAKGKNTPPSEVDLIDGGPIDEALFRQNQSLKDTMRNMLSDMHRIRTFGKILYKSQFDDSAARREFDNLQERLIKEKEERKAARLARIPSPEERERIRAEKRAAWYSANK